jgi:dihydroxyacetone kinase
MLTAGVSGEVFASPGAHAILTAIRTTTGPAGCVLIVMNYTGVSVSVYVVCCWPRHLTASADSMDW